MTIPFRALLELKLLSDTTYNRVEGSPRLEDADIGLRAEIRDPLWMLSRLAARHNEFDGESFTVLSDAGRADKPIPLAILVIDP